MAGTEFLRVYIPITQTANSAFYQTYNFHIPSRGSVNQAVTVQLNSAMGASYQYSVTVHAYKSSS